MLITLVVPAAHAPAVRAFADQLATGGQVSAPSDPIPGADYEKACSTISQSICTSFELRRRLASDHARDPVDALRDAELLYSLQAQRVRELLGPRTV